MKHYVYFLRHADGVLLYVGRSTNPKARHLDFMRREGIRAELAECKECETLQDAQACEIQAIEQLGPLYNKIVASAIGTLGRSFTPEHKQAIGRSNKNRGGWRHTPQALEAIAKSSKERGVSAKTKEASRIAWMGRKHTPESRAKMSEAARRRRSCNSQR